MRYIVDHDIHIHSKISLCSNDEKQNPDAILKYAEDNNFKMVAVTDHYWDATISATSKFYTIQNFDWISKSKPLPLKEGIRFLFGAETDIDMNMRLGLPRERFDDFDFVIITTTHLHMPDFTISKEDASSVEGRAKVWIEKLEAILSMELPFRKIGIAHLANNHIAPTREEYLQVLNLLPSDKLEQLFKKCAEVGVGIELNSSDMSFSDEEAEVVLRIFKIAKGCGCKFYLGSDSHHPETLYKAPAIFERAVDMLGLTEDDKFILK